MIRWYDYLAAFFVADMLTGVILSYFEGYITFLVSLFFLVALSMLWSAYEEMRVQMIHGSDGYGPRDKDE